MIPKKNLASVYFDSIQMTLSVVSDKGGFGCAEFIEKNVYTGVSKNFFVSPSEIEGIIVDLMNRYNSFSGKRINRLTLVLPQHFFRLQASVRSKEIDKKVTDKDLVFLKKDLPQPPEGFVLLEETEGGYSVDGQGDFTTDILGKEGNICQLLSAQIYLSDKVYELFGNISKNIRVDFDFVAPAKVMVNKLNDEKIKRGLILKINQLSSDLVYFENRLPVSSLSLSFGSFHFADVLAQKYSLEFDMAIELLNHINLGLANNNANYVFFSNGQKFSFPIKETNSILTEAIEYWAGETKSAVKGLVEEENIPLYATGSSVAKIQGFSELLSEKVGLNTYCLCPDFSVWNKPEEYVHCALFENY